MIFSGACRLPGASAEYVKTDTHITIFKIIATVAYVPPIFLRSVSGPVIADHAAKIIPIPKVSKIAANPNVKPEMMISVARTLSLIHI